MQRNIRAFYDVIKQKRLNIEFSRRLFCFCMEAAIRFELMCNGFADRCLTTWLCRQKKWSGKRDLNPRLQPWQGCTLPLSYSRS